MRTFRCAADDVLRIAADPLSTARTIREKTFLFAVGDTLFFLVQTLLLDIRTVDILTSDGYSDDITHENFSSL